MSGSHFDNFDFDDFGDIDMDLPETIDLDAPDLDVPDGDIDPDAVDITQVAPDKIRFGGSDDMVSKTSPTTTESSSNLIIGANGEGSRSMSEHIKGNDEFKPKNSNS